MYLDTDAIRPRIRAGLDKEYIPAVLFNRVFIEDLNEAGNAIPVAIAIERADGLLSVFKTRVFDEHSGRTGENLFYIERLVKSLLWIKGGWKVVVGGPAYIGEYIKKAYGPGGIREFDAKTMGRIYEKQFTVVITDAEDVPEENEKAHPIGRHLEGCRIGFDAGGSDRKAAAVIDGREVYSEEVIWHPKLNRDPDYHFNEIMAAVKKAASCMARVDGVGVSAAGVYVNNRVMSASLFIQVPEEAFEKKVKNMFLTIQKEMGGVPLEVANDGDVTALAGAMDLKAGNVLGIAMGTSEAGGYVDANGNITGWLNELAFVPVDFNGDAAVDEWSGDFGCGVKYFSQDAVIRLAYKAGIMLEEGLTPAEKLKTVQELHKNGDNRAREIFETIGCYLGYTTAYYLDFYEIRHVLVLGRVSSGEGGEIMIETARNILKNEFPEWSCKVDFHLPDESSRRVGQAIAAASLPEIL